MEVLCVPGGLVILVILPGSWLVLEQDGHDDAVDSDGLTEDDTVPEE